MRMRKRHNLEPRLEACTEFIISDPEELKGKYRSEFNGYNGFYLEIGCGKGRFTAAIAENNPENFYIAVEKVPDAMIIAAERVKNAGLKNVRFIIGDASSIPDYFKKGDVDGIYINFCDPWPKSRDAKLRLTSPIFLRSYADLLPISGEIKFKTDNTPLFDWSIEQMQNEGWELPFITRDLHGNGVVGFMTDYEAKFYAEGMKINSLTAIKMAITLDSSAPALGRLRNASLSDAYSNQIKSEEGRENA